MTSIRWKENTTKSNSHRLKISIFYTESSTCLAVVAMEIENLTFQQLKQKKMLSFIDSVNFFFSKVALSRYL